jgi:hypothetical protein
VKIAQERGAYQMKKSGFLLSSLFLISALCWGVPSVEAQELLFSVPREIADYCHPKFPVVREDSLSWEQPAPDPTAASIVDFYGPCGYALTGFEEVRAPGRVILRGDFEDGDY